MQIQRTPAIKKPAPAALNRAVAGALNDIQKIQGRMTEELRGEDAIKGLSVKSGRVVVEVDGRFDFKPAGLKDLVAQHLAKHGVTNAVVEVKVAVDEKKAVAGALADIQTIQARMTRELRVEDGIAGLSSSGAKKVTVALKAHQSYPEAEVIKAVKEHLAAHGLKGATLEIVRPAINIKPPSVIVGEAWASIQTVQQRLTADMRAEDDVLNVVAGAEPGSVRVVLGAHPHFNENEITAAVRAHLDAAGFANATIEFIRPAIQPMPRPVAPAPNPTGMKAKVEAFAADIRTVRSRTTEELRIEDAVTSIKVVGAKVELKLNRSAFDKDSVVAWAKDELTKRGVTLPLVVKT